MVLNKASKVFPVPDKKGNPLYRFCDATDKAFMLSATDQREKSEWSCVIKEVSCVCDLCFFDGL